MLAPIAARGEDIDALTGWLNRLHRARQYAENKRLFYVACTRARQELHLFAAPQLTTGGTLNPHAASLLSAAWPAASPHFAAAGSRLGPSLATPLRNRPACNSPAPDDSMPSTKPSKSPPPHLIQTQTSSTHISYQQ